MNELIMQENELIKVLQSSLYPNAAIDSVKMILGYCKAADLDPMLKPVHIVPMWDSKSKCMRDVVMPGIGLYRIQAARSGSYAGVTDAVYGGDITANIGGTNITYPISCTVTVKRRLDSGEIAEFSATERWLENYATKGKDSIAPNAMWSKRPYAQLAKCAEAQALRKAFPEIGSAPTADEMEGKQIYDNDVQVKEEIKYITIEQVNEASQLIYDTDTDLQVVLNSQKVSNLESLLPHQFEIVMKKLNDKKLKLESMNNVLDGEVLNDNT